MALRTVEANDRSYTIAQEGPVPLTQRFWGVVQAQTVDELTGRAPRTPIRLETQARGFIPRVAAGGLLGLVARPSIVFPRLAEQSYDVRFTIHVEGYIPHPVDVTFPTESTFPIRTLDPAIDPGPGATVLRLGSVDGITPGEMLLVGRSGNRERVTVGAVAPGPQQVTLPGPGLVNQHTGGDPVVAEQFVPFDPSSVLIDLGELELHRRPVVVTGTTVERSSSATPVPNATVTVTGLWRELESVAMGQPAEPPNIVSLEPPLYAGRTTAADRLRQRNMSPVTGEDKTLLEWASAEEDRLVLSNWVNLSAGDILEIDADPALQEYVSIDTISATGAAELPATVSLTHPLAYTHRPGARVRRVVPQAPGPNRVLAQDAAVGDTCLFMNSLSGLSENDVVEVFGGSAPTEFHRLHLFTAQSDSEGRYRLPPLSRVAKLEVEATKGADTATATVIPNYLNREHHLNIEF